MIAKVKPIAPADVGKATRDPALFFATPEEVLERRELRGNRKSKLSGVGSMTRALRRKQILGLA